MSKTTSMLVVRETLTRLCSFAKHESRPEVPTPVEGALTVTEAQDYIGKPWTAGPPTNRRNQMFRARPMIAGLLLAIGSVLVLVLLPKAQSREVLAILLAALGGLYAGLGLAGQSTSKFALQAGVSAVFVILSIAGLWFSPWLLALGFFAHAAWDTVHHPRALNIFVPGWYIPACLAYDTFIAMFVLAWW